jgi:hypothetical protein
MKKTTLLKIGSSLLVLWGILNLIGGIVGSFNHPSYLVMPFFGLAGLLIITSGIGFWSNKKWALCVALIALTGLSMTALYSASVLRGWAHINIMHQLTRFAVSAIILTIAVIGRRKID